MDFASLSWLRGPIGGYHHREWISLATSTGGTLTWRGGGDLIIIDDPLKAEDAYL